MILGFFPDIVLKDNSLVKLELGDVNETLLRRSINLFGRIR